MEIPINIIIKYHEYLKIIIVKVILGQPTVSVRISLGPLTVPHGGNKRNRIGKELFLADL